MEECFGEIMKAEDVRFNSNQLELYNAENAEGWQKNSKISMKIAKDMIEMIVEKAAKTLYDHYIHKKLSDHIIKASYMMTDTLLVN